MFANPAHVPFRTNFINGLGEPMGLKLGAIEACGGGDCLFLSLAVGLQELVVRYPDFRQNGCCPSDALNLEGSAIQIAPSSRSMVARKISSEPPEEFLD